jgi:hypothetical protein
MESKTNTARDRTHVMDAVRFAIASMIDVTKLEMDALLSDCFVADYAPKEFLSKQGEVSNNIFFVVKGITGVKSTQSIFRLRISSSLTIPASC